MGQAPSQGPRATVATREPTMRYYMGFSFLMHALELGGTICLLHFWYFGMSKKERT